MLPVFEAWDLAVEPVAARSRFYALPPIGLGTPFVESLTGYVVRLAEAHAVSTGSLVGKELSGSINPGGINLGNVAYAINGVGDSAKRWVQALETMTLRSDIRYLTLLPFEPLFPKPFLFRRVRAWCPTCYEATASQSEPIYEQLLWCLKLVEVCPRHRGFLTTTCPHCLRPQRPLSATSRSGFCSRCGLWLGDKRPRAAPPLSDAAPTDYQLWLADAIGYLLANAARILPEHLRDRVQGALVAYADAFTEGNRTAVADVAGCGRSIFYSWFKGDKAPRIDTLLRTWYRLRLPVACLVDGVYPGFSPEVRTERSCEIRKIRDTAPKRSPEQIRRALETALHEEPAPALHEVARRLGYRTTERLRCVDRELCKQVVLNHRKSGRSHWWRRRGAKPICELSRVREVLKDHLASDKPIPPLDHIAASLGYAIDQSIRQKFPELCLALSARIAEQRKARLAAIEPALRQALQETPPPSCRQVAIRIGFSGASVLKVHAPGLYEKLKKHRQAYEERCRLDLRSRLEAALVQNPPPSLTAVYSRLGVTESIVSTSFPELRQAIGTRHLQYQQLQSRQRRDALRVEIREVVRMLHAQGICPSVPRVTSLLSSGSLREWRVVSQAVSDARRELIAN